MDVIEELNKRPSFAFYDAVKDLSIDQLAVAERVLVIKRLMSEHGFTRRVELPEGVVKFRHFLECCYADTLYKTGPCCCICSYFRQLSDEISHLLLDRIENNTPSPMFPLKSDLTDYVNFIDPLRVQTHSYLRAFLKPEQL